MNLALATAVLTLVIFITACTSTTAVTNTPSPLSNLNPISHSPTGLEWSYGGGPADLALSILTDYFNERPTADDLYHGWPRCWTYHQAFKRDVMAGADRTGFTITSDQVAEWLRRVEQSEH